MGNKGFPHGWLLGPWDTQGRAGASAEPGATRLPAASSGLISQRPVHPWSWVLRDGTAALCLRGTAPACHLVLGYSDPRSPWIHTSPPNPGQPRSGHPAASCSSLPCEHDPVLQLSVWAGKTARQHEEQRLSAPQQRRGADGV